MTTHPFGGVHDTRFGSDLTCTSRPASALSSGTRSVMQGCHARSASTTRQTAPSSTTSYPYKRACASSSSSVTGRTVRHG